MIRVELNGDRELALELERIPKRVHESLQRTMLRLVIFLQRYVVAQKLEGQVLKSHTHNLVRSIVYDTVTTQNSVSGFVGVAKTAPYGKIHELGGSVNVKQHMRKSKLGNMSSVRGHMATYPKRAFLVPSLDENEEKIQLDLKKAVDEAI